MVKVDRKGFNVVDLTSWKPNAEALRRAKYVINFDFDFFQIVTSSIKMLTSVVCSFDDKELVKSFVGIIRLSKVMSNLILPSFIWNLIIICTFF